MNTIQLEQNWAKLINEGAFNFISNKINENCIPNLYLGINKKQNRCLLLFLPKNYKIKFVGDAKENLVTSYNKKENCIVLELLDKYYFNLFNDLIISLYFKIYNIDEVNKSTSLFINTINKWAAFLANSRNNKLNEKTIRGLFGELTVLNDMLQESSPSNVNNILKSWVGPYDANTDFVFDDKNIEVKTKNTASSVVRISSEFQLDNELGKKIHLLVVSIKTDNSYGENIESIVNRIRKKIHSLGGDISILFDALAQKSLFNHNLTEYNKHMYKLNKHDVFDCSLIIENNSTFPRLIKSELPDFINKVKYNINLQELNKFIIDQKIF